MFPYGHVQLLLLVLDSDYLASYSSCRLQSMQA